VLTVLILDERQLLMDKTVLLCFYSADVILVSTVALALRL